MELPFAISIHPTSMDAATGTKDGKLTEDSDVCDESFIYEELTEFLISFPPAKKKRKELPKLPLRQSLFPNVAPYVAFQRYDQVPLTFPAKLTERLKWELSLTTPNIVRKTVLNSGYTLVQGAEDWCGRWGETMYAFCFKMMKNYQKVNHFPGAYEIGHKDRLWKNLNRLMTAHGRKHFGFIPRTYILPHDLDKLRRIWDKSTRKKWILKPPASSRGRGIRVVSQWTQIPRKSSFVVVQQYLSKPKLIDGAKFDIRFYALVTNFNPLKLYLYSEGLVRFACAKYDNNVMTLDNRFMHLTNYSVNKSCPHYVSNDDIDQCKGHKWSLRCLWSYLEGQNVDTSRLMKRIQDMIVKTVISGESPINTFSRVYLSSSYSCFELLGIDVLLDENLKPWLLEVNISPSLHTPSPLDIAVKGPLIQNVLNIVGYQIPSKLPGCSMHQLAAECNIGIVCQDFRVHDVFLSNRERLKQNEYVDQRNRSEYLHSILENLTPDDVRHLVQYEDELSQMGHFQKIFPMTDTHKYFKFFKVPRYYNLLLDAWENAYSANRDKGISRLRELCSRKYHLSRRKD